MKVYHTSCRRPLRLQEIELEESPLDSFSSERIKRIRRRIEDRLRKEKGEEGEFVILSLATLLGISTE